MGEICLFSFKQHKIKVDFFCDSNAARSGDTFEGLNILSPAELRNLDKDTNVTAYYLVVGEIFSNLTDFLMTCNTNPYIRDHQKCLDYLYQLSILDKRRVTNDDKYYSTMRMSIAELEV